MSQAATDDEDPKCDRCGAPMTTALMAAICPYRERCEFWPDDEDSQEFLDGLGIRYVPPPSLSGHKPTE